MAVSLGDAQAGFYGGGAQAHLGSDFQALTPYVSTVSAAPTGQQQVLSPSSTNTGGNLAKFTGFLGNVFHETGHIAEGAVQWLGKNALNMAEAPFKMGADLGHAYLDNSSVNSLAVQTQQQSLQMKTLRDDFRAGRINSQQYSHAIKGLTATADELSRQAMGLNNQIKADATSAKQDTIDTASALVTILTSGLGSIPDAVLTRAGLEPLAAKGTADYLTSVNANAMLDNVSKGIGKLATDPEAFGKLSPTAQYVLQHATAEVLAGKSAALTAPQIARATAVNVALKYPVYFNYLSTTGHQVYQELDQKKYGAAVRTVAFNAALMLAGGPIGQALKYGGKTVTGISARTFARTSFIDELSKGIGDGDSAGLYKAVMKLAPEERGAAIKGLSAVEATNLAATGGNDSVAAAWRVLKGMANYEGMSMSQFSHDEALQNMVNFAKNQQIADMWGQKLGKNLTVGRFDVRAKTQIAKQLAEAPDGTRAQVWEQMKFENPNQAWANNESFDKQIHSLIDLHTDGGELGTAIQNINAATTIDGIPKGIVNKMAKDGYVVIEPQNLEASFKPGSGTVATSFAARNDEHFIKAVQPLPILSHVGDALTRLGLSPNASNQRVYDLFNSALSENLKGAGVLEKNMLGESEQSQSDILIKKLSNYAHDPTRKGIANKTPITDLRMMTKKDIQAATGTTIKVAGDIQTAIAKAYLQVPLSIRGLGDKAVDALYATPGVKEVSRRFFRAEGAGRFAWNPFFQYMRVIPKTEILSAAEGGGFLRSIFQGNAGKLDEIRTGLRDAGMFDEAGKFGNVISGEATDYGGTTTKNITKKLLPMQERSIAGLINSQAERMGMDWQTYAQHFPDNVRDTIQAIAQYDRNANFLNSPMARTLNIAFFPFRFDAKVAGFLAKGLANTAPLTQVAVLNGLFKAHDFMNSPEGQAWYAKNSEAIGLFKYITPIATIAEVFSSLTPGHDHSLGNFGELGGLPFGWIPQLLDAEGLTHFSQPYMDSKTGKMVPDYVPATLKGQAAVAIQDLIGSLFSYPGATAGLPSKSSVTRALGNGLTGASTKTDFTQSTPQPSPDQAAYAQHIQQNGPRSQHGVVSLPPSQASATTVPVTGTATAQPRYKNGTNKPSAKKLKKADYKPSLLPGQSQLGQL